MEAKRPGWSIRLLPAIPQPTPSPDLRTFAEQVTSLGHNLIGVGGGTSGWLATDLVGTRTEPLNPRLGPLLNDGGPTPTHALLTVPVSPAIHAGDDTVASEFDQRGPGFTRMYGRIDIGSYELLSPVLGIFQSGNHPVLFWATNDPSCGLLTTASLSAPVQWSVVSEPPTAIGYNFHLTNEFFSRLHVSFTCSRGKQRSGHEPVRALSEAVTQIALLSPECKP